jgi:hypothetical protein
LRVLLAVMLCLGCSRDAAPPAEQSPKRPRLDLTVWLDQEPQGDPQTAVAISTRTPPKERVALDRSGIRVAIIGVPAEGDAQKFLEPAVGEADGAGFSAIILVSTRCLADLSSAIEKKIHVYWKVPLVVGAACEAKVKPALGAALMVEAGSISRVRITFDRRTQAFLKVEPIR